MATPEHIRHELLDRLDRAGPNGVAQSLFLRTVSFALSELRLSALASGPITLRVELEPGIEPDGAMLEANLAAALAAAPIGPTGERRLDIDAAMFERLRQGTVVTRPALPSAEQVEACAWLVENAAAVARTIGEVFAEEAGAPRNVRPSVGSRAVLGEWEFAVAEVFIRAPVAAGVAGVAQPTRSNVVLRGACGWDEEHGFALELSRGAVVMHGSWSCVPVP